MFVVLLVVVLNIVLGLLIFVRNAKATTNRLFLLLTVMATLWCIASFLTDSANQTDRLAWGRLAFMFPVLFSVCLALLARVFPVNLKTSWRYLSVIVAAGLLNAAICLTPLVVSGAYFEGDTTKLVPGPLYGLFIVIEILLFAAAGASFLQARKLANSSQKSQANFVAIGISVGFVVALACNALLPLVNLNDAVKYGPLGTIFFVAATAYAIVRHQLFDIRTIAARSLGYILSIASFSAVYVGVGFLLVGHLLFGAENIAISLQVAYTTLAVVLALTFPSLKQFFDTATRKFFFRDAYDTQVFLDDFNKMLVTTFELSPLLKKSAMMIIERLKPSYAVFDIGSELTITRKVSGFGAVPKLTTDERDALLKILAKNSQKIIVTDDLDQKDQMLREQLQSHSIAIVIRLTTGRHDKGIGYLMLGPKKSGNPFSSQDVKVISIVTNGLVIAVQNSLRIEEIENFNLTLQAKVEEATRKLRRTNEKLKELDEAKDDFVSMASHQLRTPLTSIKGYTSMVLEGDAGKINATQRQLLEQSFFSAQRMVYLIADLLNVSRLKTGKFLIEPMPVNLAEVVSQEIGQLKEVAAGRSLTLTYEQPETFPTLLLDETKTRQVIMNFVDNAIYYTPAGGTIQVKLLETESSVELRVTDSGIGVPKSEQPHLFTKFYRANNARTARPDGTGLGLFMAKKVIVAEGGAIVFHTEEGKGSTFGFVFPKTKLAPES
jgi:signal transduction histidine kinase